MKKIMNRPENFVDETMEGIVLAYGEQVGFLNDDRRILISKAPVCEGKVGIVTAGGSGHLPVFLGYVGSGMLDGCAVGNVFASPSARGIELLPPFVGLAGFFRKLSGSIQGTFRLTLHY